MDHRNRAIVLYTAQSTQVLAAIEKDGICFSRREYVEKKYEEIAPVFVAAYDWFSKEAERYLPKPTGAQYPYWAFSQVHNVEQSGDVRLLKMHVPIDEVILFDMLEWNKVLSLQYIGDTEEDEMRFQQLLKDYGIKRHSDVVLTNFYPELKRQVQDSWKKLFRNHERIKSQDIHVVENLQTALWCLKKEWIADKSTEK